MMNESSTSKTAKENNIKRFKKSAMIYIASLGIGALTGIILSLHQKGILNLSTNTLIIGTSLLILLI